MDSRPWGRYDSSAHSSLYVQSSMVKRMFSVLKYAKKSWYTVNITFCKESCLLCQLFSHKRICLSGKELHVHIKMVENTQKDCFLVSPYQNLLFVCS